MLALILSLINPIFKTIASIFVSFSNEQVAEVQAKSTVDVASIQGEAAVQTRWWFVPACTAIFALIFIPYDFKAVVWDNVIMNGTTSTPALHGDLQWIHLTVVSGLFLHSVFR